MEGRVRAGGSKNLAKVCRAFSTLCLKEPLTFTNGQCRRSLPSRGRHTARLQGPGACTGPAEAQFLRPQGDRHAHPTSRGHRGHGQTSGA